MCVNVCVRVCVFSIHPFPRSHQKTKTTAVKGIIPRGNGREKLPITQRQTHRHTHVYAPCHDVHPDIPSQLLKPHAQPVQVDILHKHTYSIKNMHTIHRNRCSDRSVCLRQVVVCTVFSRQVSVLLSTILTLYVLCCLTSSHLDSSTQVRCTQNTLVGYEETAGKRQQCFFCIH